MAEKTKSRHYNTPIVHKEFSDLGNERHALKVRVLQYQNVHYDKPTEPKLDIRQFLQDHKNPDGTVYTGFTQRGISLSWDDLHLLSEMLPDIIATMDGLGEKKARPKKEK